MDLRALSSSSKKEKHCGDQGVDNISNLPKNVVDHILSFLSFVDVVKMSILSRRWLYTWTSVSNIVLVNERSYGIEKVAGQGLLLLSLLQTPIRTNLLEFVDRVLTLHDDSDIKRLKLRLDLPEKFPHLNKWISVAINHNIQELDLFLCFEPQNELPCWLFSCRSLIMLKITALLTIRAPPRTFFLNLKKLSFTLITFSDDKSSQRIFSGCPVLEELALENCNWKHIKNVTISIATLKSLTIDHFDEMEAVDCTIKISSINLTNFSCRTDLKVNIDMCELPSLDSAKVTVDISYSDRKTNGFVERARSLFSAIYNVKVLKTSPDTLMYITDEIDILDYVHTFHKLTHLRVGVGRVAEEVFYGGSIITFLQKTPQLEHLDIFESYGYFGSILELVPSCFKTSLMICSITHFRGTQVEMELVGFVLTNATLLQSMIISCDYELSNDELNVVKNRINVLRIVSDSCVIEWRETS